MKNNKSMKNKIITLPVNGGAGEVPTINRFQMDMENLLDTTADTPKDDLFIDTLKNDVSAEDWERYTRIVRSIFAAGMLVGIWSPSSISINLFLDRATVQTSQSRSTITAPSPIPQG